MSKRVAVVTGGIGGLGTEICKSLARAGRTVVAADLGRAPSASPSSASDVDGLDIHFETANVGDFDACGDLVRKIEARPRPDRHPRQRRRHHPRHARCARWTAPTGTRC